MFEKTFLIHFSDCDPEGIVFFARYFDWAHQTLEEWISHSQDATELTGPSRWEQWFRNPEIAVPLIKAEARYQSPAHAGSQMTAHLAVERVGETSVQFKFQFACRDQGSTADRPCAEVQTAHVFVDKHTFKSIKIPEAFRAWLAP